MSTRDDLLGAQDAARASPRTPPLSTAAAKVALFSSFFRGRNDVFPKLWINARTGRRGIRPCGCLARKIARQVQRLYIQHDSPGPDKEANWLPGPADRFVLMMRTYWSKEKSPSILNGTWKIPRVREVP